MVRAAEAQGVQIGHRPRAHGEHVAQDAAHAGRRALVGLDEAGMVVAFHLEDGGLAVADVDDAGVLAGAADHPRRFGRQLAQMAAGRLVGTMLGPHHRKNTYFNKIWCTTKNFFYFFKKNLFFKIFMNIGLEC